MEQKGLTEQEALQNQKKYGLNIIHKSKINPIRIFTAQFTSNPLIIILAIATAISFSLGQTISSLYIFGIIVVSILLRLINEYAAEKTVESLLKKIAPTAIVNRNGEKKEIPFSHVTIGDIILLSQGSIIPADIEFLETQNIEIDESVLTGESQSLGKKSKDTGYMGTSIESGSGVGIVVKIGQETKFGKIAEEASFLKPQTEFQKGLSQFGNLILITVLILTFVIFAVNSLLGHNILSSLLFSLAIAVGLTPELLPVIVTVSLSHGAGRLSKKHVVVKRLLSIENLGNMDVLCTDKTGTLTEGKITVTDFIDTRGEKNISVLEQALSCTSTLPHQKAGADSIDKALWQYVTDHNLDQRSIVLRTKTIFVEPFDYTRKMMFTVVQQKNKTSELLVKGAPDEVLKLCKHILSKASLERKIKALNKEGFRTIVIAKRELTSHRHAELDSASHEIAGQARNDGSRYSWDDVKDLTFVGYITLIDTPRPTAKEALQKLKTLNVDVKILTGDNELVTQKVCDEVGLHVEAIILGPDIENMSEEKLQETVKTTNVFARMSPEHKLKVIQVLRKLGHTVGYLGDGINDLPALHNADVGISVNTAIDVAKDSASVVLLQKSLHVIADGIEEGRRTFANTIKYILMSTSSNFGNMFSAAGASFFLPFLPMTPVQILLTNGLYDISQLSIPTDNVDPESLVRPRHWDVKFIKNYMLFFGPLSSIFDFITFGIMIFLFHARGPLFQTGWFVESVATEILVVFVIRTARTPFFLSRPSKLLLITCLAMVGTGLVLPFTPLASHLGFLAPPPLYFVILIILVATYVFLVEMVKNIFLKRYSL